MSFAELMNDNIEVLKKDGTRVPGLKASVQRNKVFLVSCCRFQRHRVQCIDETGGGAWSDESLRKSSSWRPCG